MSYDISEHKCVDKAKVNSLVKSLETMKNEKSDLKMAVYKQFDSLGEQFTDILYQNNCDAPSSCCVVPIRGQLTQQIQDDPDAMNRAQMALEDQGEPPCVEQPCCQPEPEECVIERKPLPLTLKDILCDSNCDDTTSCCIIPIVNHSMKQIQDDPEAMRRAQRALEELDNVTRHQSPIEIPKKPKPAPDDKTKPPSSAPVDKPKPPPDMTVFGAIGGRARQLCSNCDKHESSTDPKSGLCNECQLYQKQYNKPRPTSMRENTCLYCCATIWIECKSDEILYCENCKRKVLSTSSKEITSTEYNLPVKDEFKDLRTSIIQKYAAATKKPIEVAAVVAPSPKPGTEMEELPIELTKPMEWELIPMKKDESEAIGNNEIVKPSESKKKNSLANKIIESVSVFKKKETEVLFSGKLTESMEVQPICKSPKEKDVKETPAVKVKEPTELQPPCKPKDVKATPPCKPKDAKGTPPCKPRNAKETPPCKPKDAKETPVSVKVKEPAESPCKPKDVCVKVKDPKEVPKEPCPTKDLKDTTAKKKNEVDSFSIAARESESDKLSQDDSFASMPSGRRSSTTLSVDYGGEQCFDCEGIRPLRNKKKSQSNCTNIVEDNDRFVLRGVIKNQSYDQTEQAREGSSSGSGLPERKQSDVNLLNSKRSSNSITFFESQAAPSEPDIPSGVQKYIEDAYFKRNENSPEQENDSRSSHSRSSQSRSSVTTAHFQNGNDENRSTSTEEIGNFDQPEAEINGEEKEKFNLEHHSKNRYSFEDFDVFPILSDKVFKPEV
uniref:Uncharacterized protein n=1 Tax=Strigamia maritima TaxID=126957 RepID=T1J3Z0_STRMM